MLLRGVSGPSCVCACGFACSCMAEHAIASVAATMGLSHSVGAATTRTTLAVTTVEDRMHPRTEATYQPDEGKRKARCQVVNATG